jgi:hypothetical protein
VRVIVLLLCGILLAGCAGTLNYPEYAKAQAEIYRMKAQMRTALVQAYVDTLTRGTNKNAQIIAAVGLMMLMQKDNRMQLEIPQDQITKVVDILAPFVGITAVAGYMGHYMSKLGTATTTTTTNTYNSTLSGTQNSMNTVPGNANTFTYHSDWSHEATTDNHAVTK